jgi:hypothetical protein
MAVLMTAATVGLLWYDQRVAFRALALTPVGSDLICRRVTL